jgi:rhodanese-related sulfurtransferase
MSWGGNTIARALALVSVATLGAFIHWANRPIQRDLAAPKPEAAGRTQPAPESEPVPGRDPGEAPPDAEATGDETTGDDAQPPGEAQSTPDAPGQAFDPNALGTEITTADAYELWAGGRAVFIDARSQAEYEAGHIPFAFLVPPETLRRGRLGRMMEEGGVFSDMRVVVYCEGGSCDASHLVALHLQDMGFERIHIDVDGFPAWRAAGHEVETGPDAVLGGVE